MPAADVVAHTKYGDVLPSSADLAVAAVELLSVDAPSYRLKNALAQLKDQYDEDENILKKVAVEDLREFGMIPEFLGRLPILYTLEGLTKEMMIKILREPKNAILKQYQKLLEQGE